ncbi:hypothetical protein ACQ4M3_37730 [Leptolyngbya sp. AN03gr2]|uniref:hypothetical protein n=1 Tax=unclassified Leptolyngbya TaxID=2650499 RepID=UPI003D318815
MPNPQLGLVETSGTDDFEYVRAFYRKNGYDEEARIREFYCAGADKIIFRKALPQRSQNKLIAAARKAKQEIAEGLSMPMDYEQL